MTARLAIAFCLCLGLASCALLFPRKAALDLVHDTYRSDFRNYVAAQPSDICKYSTAFDNSLEAIRAFEKKYAGEKTAEMGHVLVLKGMIHLQAKHFGTARAMQGQVTAATIAASDDREVRDTLFKKTFADLLNGWEEVCKVLAATLPDDASAAAVLEKSADNILKHVREATKRPGLESDDGAIYLATTASIFQFYTMRMKADACMPPTPCAGAYATFEAKLKEGTDAIYDLMTADEQKAAEAKGVFAWKARCNTVTATPTGWKDAEFSRSRQRYVEWYAEVKSYRPCPKAP